MCPFSNILTPQRKALLEREEQGNETCWPNVSVFSFFVCHFSKVIGGKGGRARKQDSSHMDFFLDMFWVT